MESEPPHKPLAFQPKQSRANKLWICTVVIVLLVLFFETGGNSRHSSNCCISTASEGIGAEVFIDGQKVGTIGRDEKGGLGGGAYRCLLAAGHHEIEIKKPGFKTFSEQFDMRRERYVQVNLEKSGS